MKKLLGLGVLLTLALTVSAQAQQPLTLDNLLPAGSGAASGQIVQLFGLLTVLSIAPGLLIMVTPSPFRFCVRGLASRPRLPAW